MFEARIAAILERLSRLRAQDLRTETIDLGGVEVVGYRCAVHGATRHRYEFRDSIDDLHLAEFEDRLGMQLPSEYRSWIIQVADGGAGPMYGLIPLSDEPEAMTLEYGSDFVAEQAIATRTAADDTDIWKRNTEILHRGMTFVAEEGDGAWNVLILRGSAAGQIWWLDAEHAIARPILHPERRSPVGFLDWYELWLERAFTESKIGSFAELI